MTQTVMMTPSEIAERDRVSKQAVSKTVRGLVAKHDDIPVERDGRGRLVRISVAHYDHYCGRYQNPAKVMAARASEPTSVSPAGDAPQSDSYEEARRRNEWLKYQRQKLEHEEEAGRLVRAEKVSDALEMIGREIQAIVMRIQNKADELSLAAAKEGVHGLRVSLRDEAYRINGEIAEKLTEIAVSAPATEAVEDEEPAE